MPLALIWHGLGRHWLRTGLTMASITIAVFLVCSLQSLLVALNAGIEASAANRLWVQSAVSLFVDLPLAYQPRIAQVPGAEVVSKFQWFAGVYKDDKSNFFPQFAVDHDTLLRIYPEMKIIDGSIDDFCADRRACVVGKSTMKRFEWKVGDTIPLKGTIFPRADGSAWEFHIAAVYDSDTEVFDKTLLLFHQDYLQDALETGESLGPRGTGTYVVKVAPGTDVTAVMSAIDALYENGPQRVQTTTEAEFNRQFVSMMGNIPDFMRGIGGGVSFAILLAALNTMVMAGRERTRDFGILKAVGFRSSVAFRLLLAESLLVCGLGGGIGLLLFLASSVPMATALGSMFPGYHVSSGAILLGAGLALGVGLLAGIVPAWQAGRLRPVEALRHDA